VPQLGEVADSTFNERLKKKQKQTQKPEVLILLNILTEIGKYQQ
jgi:hypothetical protein